MQSKICNKDFKLLILISLIKIMHQRNIPLHGGEA